MFDLKGKKVTILGAKRSGLALAKLITYFKGIPRISEQGGASALSDDLKKIIKENKIAYELNGHTQAFIEDSDMIVLSPGVPFHSKAVEWAKAKGLLVLGEIEFAFQFCSKPVIAVTGSNGKTTTVTLMSEVLKAAGYRLCLCGNVGMPFSGFVLNLKDKAFVVLEISSFQLESVLDPQSPFRTGENKNHYKIRGFQPHVAVLLNFSQNHLDRHNDLQEYFDAKKRVFLNQTKKDFAVLNYQNKWLKALPKVISPKVVFFNKPGIKSKVGIKDPNQLAVLEVARILKIKDDVVLKVFQSFKGVEHRLELVRSIHGVDFINDSKATTPEAGRWALTNIEKPILMICGGRDKNFDFSVLHDLVRKKVKKMYVIGEAREKLKKTFLRIVPLEECNDLESAIQRARQFAAQGDCVVLTPMCASFDMFKDYEHRGKVYKDIVNHLS